MTSGDLMVAMGVASAATANAWADAYSELSAHPVKRNSKGMRDFDEVQVAIIIEAYKLHKTGQATTRKNALTLAIGSKQLRTSENDLELLETTNKVLEDKNNKVAEAKRGYNDLENTSDSSEYFSIEHLPKVVSEKEATKSELDNQNQALKTTPSDNALQYPKSKLLPTKSLRFHLGLMVIFSTLIQIVIYTGSKTIKFTRWCFIVRENPLWTLLPPRIQRTIIKQVYFWRWVVCLVIGFATAFCLIAYLVSKVMILFGLTPVFVPWDRIAMIILYTFIAALVFYFLFPNDLD